MEPKFSGHETFPLRYGWLYKSTNFLKNNTNFRVSKNQDMEQAIVELGVGKNMVSSMRYWSEASGMVKVDKATSAQHLTDLATYLFVKNNSGNEANRLTNGKDPYLERKGSIWLLHFLLNFNERELTSYRYFFNLTSFQQFDKEKLLHDIEADCAVLCKKEVKTSSIKKDIDCFLHSYCPKHTGLSGHKKKVSEDNFSSPLSELKLIGESGKNSYVALLEERHDLPVQVFMYALLRFIQETRMATSASFDALLADQNSPGKIFRLSERGLSTHIENAANKYSEIIELQDSQGLRQVKVLKKYSEGHTFFEVLDEYYGKLK